MSELWRQINIYFGKYIVDLSLIWKDREWTIRLYYWRLGCRILEQSTKLLTLCTSPFLLSLSGHTPGDVFDDFHCPDKALYLNQIVISCRSLMCIVILNESFFWCQEKKELFSLFPLLALSANCPNKYYQELIYLSAISFTGIMAINVIHWRCSLRKIWPPEVEISLRWWKVKQLPGKLIWMASR